MAKAKATIVTGTAIKVGPFKVKWAAIDKPDTKFNANGVFYVDGVFEPEVFEDIRTTIDKQLPDLMGKALDMEKSPVIKAKLKKVTSEELLKPYIEKDGTETTNIKTRFQNRKEKPIVLDAKKQPFNGPVFGGDTVNIVFRPRVYGTGQGAGISLVLDAVQLLEKGNYSGGSSGKASADLLGEEEGFVASQTSEDPEGSAEEEI